MSQVDLTPRRVSHSPRSRRASWMHRLGAPVTCPLESTWISWLPDAVGPHPSPTEIRWKSQLGRRGRGGSTEALRCIPVWKEVGTHALAQSRRLPEGPSSCYLSRAASSACLERPLHSQHLLGHNCLPRDSWKWDFARALTCYLILILFYGSCGFLCCWCFINGSALSSEAVEILSIICSWQLSTNQVEKGVPGCLVEGGGGQAGITLCGHRHPTGPHCLHLTVWSRTEGSCPREGQLCASCQPGRAPVLCHASRPSDVNWH